MERLSDAQLQQLFSEGKLQSRAKPISKEGAKPWDPRLHSDDDASDGSGDDQAEIPTRKQGAVAINNTVRLASILDEIETSGKMDWIETNLVLVPEIADDVDVDDDLIRERAIADRALHAWNVAEKKFKIAKVATERPKDYYVEMLKSDEHMRRVRANIMNETHAVEASEKAKKLRQMKKYGKKVQVQVLEKRQAEKKRTIEEASRHRRNLQNKASHDFDNTAGEDRGNKRRKKDKRFGSGGKTTSSTRKNSSESSADMSGFSVSRNKAPRPWHATGKKQSGSASKTRKARPGKARRQLSRNRK